MGVSRGDFIPPHRVAGPSAAPPPRCEPPLTDLFKNDDDASQPVSNVDKETGRVFQR